MAVNPDFEIPVIEFETPTPPRPYLGMNPNAAGYRQRAGLCALLLLVLIVPVGVAVIGLSTAKRASTEFSIAYGMACVLSAFALCCLWMRTKFCPLCGARTKSPFRKLPRAWCPACRSLSDRRQMLRGAEGVLDLQGSDYLAHPDPIPTFLANVVLLAICENAKELTLEVRGDEYDVAIVRQDGTYRLVPPPSFIHFPVEQTVKAIAGLPLHPCDQPHHGEIDVVARGRSIRTRVSVQPTALCQKLVFEWT